MKNISANIIGNLRKPYLWVKYRLDRRRRIKKILSNLHSIEEIIEKSNECYNKIIDVEKQPYVDEKEMARLKGWVECIWWILKN